MKRIITTITLTAAAGLALTSCNAGPAGSSGSASNYPTKPVTIVVPFAAGGGSDATARQLAAQLEEDLGGTFLVENREGAAGAVGTDSVAKTAADGYTLISTNTFALTAGEELRDTEYSLTDFVGIGELSTYGVVQVVAADSEWETLDDMLQADSLTYAHPGVGGMFHVAQESLFEAADVEAKGVPFDGGAPAVTALLGGQVDTTVSDLGVVLPYIESGDLKALSVSTPERIEELPDVPTVEEEGYGDATLTASEVLLAPAGLPDDIRSALEDSTEKAVSSEEFQDFLANGRYQSGDVFGTALDEELQAAQQSIVDTLGRLDIKVTD